MKTNKIQCLECNQYFLTLWPHIKIHKLKPKEYKKKWNVETIVSEFQRYINGNSNRGKKWAKIYLSNCKTCSAVLENKGFSRTYCNTKCRNNDPSYILRVKEGNSKTKKDKIKLGTNIVWNKGLRKETDERLKIAGEKENKLHNPEKYEKTSKSLKLYYADPKNREKASLKAQKRVIQWSKDQFKYKTSKSEALFGDKIYEKFGIILIPSFWLDGRCFDYKVPNKNILIECDGRYWHSLPIRKQIDILKNNIAQTNNYQLLRFEINNVNEVEKIIDDNIEKLKEILNWKQ